MTLAEPRIDVPCSIDTSPMKSRSCAVARIIFGVVARLESFEFAAQNNCQSEIALPGLEKQSPRFITRRSPKGSSSESW